MASPALAQTLDQIAYAALKQAGLNPSQLYGVERRGSRAFVYYTTSAGDRMVARMAYLNLVPDTRITGVTYGWPVVS